MLASCTLSIPGQTLLRELPLRESPAVQFGSRVWAIASGDVDGDGDLDLLVGLDSRAEVHYANNGSFTTVALTTEPNTSPAFAAIGDIDGDGNPDLLLGNLGTTLSPRLRIWWGNGTGQFANSATSDLNIPRDFAISEVLLLDFDRDGDLDLVICSTNAALTQGALLYVNQGSRSFAQAGSNQFPQLATGTCKPFAVDLDGDQRPDLLLVSRTGRTRLLWNNPTGFAEATVAQFPVITASLRGCAAADFDNDGDLDLAFGGDQGPGLLLRQIAVRQFLVEPTIQLPGRTVHVEAGDYDGDGLLDLAFITKEQVQIRKNRMGTAFDPWNSQGSCDYTEFVVPCDLNGDGQRDLLRIGLPLLTTSPPPPRTAASLGIRQGVYEHHPGGRLALTTQANFRGPARNGSGTRNLMAFGIREQHPVHFQQLQFATFEPNGVARHDFISRVNTPAVSLHGDGRFADLDGDGYDDFLMPFSLSFLRNRQGVMDPDATPLPPVAGYWIDATGVDVDGDGIADLVALVRNGNLAEIRVFASRAQGWVEETGQLLNAPSILGSSGWLCRGDFDGDGRIDLWVLTNQAQMILRNHGGMLQFVPGALPVAVTGEGSAHVGDIDGDGDLDLITGRALMLNDGSGRFTNSSHRLPPLDSSRFIRDVVDLDDDGDLDLLGNFGVIWNNGFGQFTLATSAIPTLNTNGMLTTWVDVDRDNDLDLIVQTTSPDRVHLYINMVRQLEILGPTTLGGTIEFRYTANPGDNPSPIWASLACSFLAQQPQQLQDIGWLMIDPATTFVVGGWALPAVGGVIHHTESVPNAASLRGVRFYAQSVEIRHNRFRLGNRVDAVLGI